LCIDAVACQFQMDVVPCRTSFNPFFGLKQAKQSFTVCIKAVIHCMHQSSHSLLK